MKPLPLILSFLPLIAFSLLARLLPHGDVGAAALTAAVIAVIAAVAVRPVWPPKVVNATSIVLFTVFAVVGFAGSAGTDRWLATWAAAGVALVMGLVILALIPVIPFTEQFARLSTPQAYWSSPTFKQINRVLSLGWGVALLGVGASRVVAVALDGHTTRRLPDLLLGLVIPGLILTYMLKFSKSYPERVTHQAQAEAPAK
jgi:intracellular septation protein A